MVYVCNSMTTHETYFPDAVWENIFSYFHSSYKKPSHFVAWEQAKTTNPGDDYTVRWMNSLATLATLGLDAGALNIWYDVRTGYIHKHIKKIRALLHGSYDELLPYDQSHEDEILDQELNKDSLHEELRDFVEESIDLHLRLLPHLGTFWHRFFKVFLERGFSEILLK